jgi:hypothetical protein
MKTPLSLLPDARTLEGRLRAALNGAGSANDPVTVLKRTATHYMSTFPNEIVTCRLPGGRKRRVFVKYGAGRGHPAFGHRGNLAYEAQVYRHVLRALPGFRPKCLGAHTDPGTGGSVLFLEYADRCVPLSEASWKRRTCQPRPMAHTARWLARFHAYHQPRVDEPSLAFLKRYDAAYYRGWAQRTFAFARPLQPRFPWLPDLRACGDAWFAPLLLATSTVIHGEFFARTVLVRDEKLFTLDWESAAVGPGEIDLAMLTDGEGWPGKLVRRWEEGYRRVRWPGGVAAEFHRTLAAARVYAQFRWLGDRPEKTLREKSLWRFDHLCRAAKKLGLL